MIECRCQATPHTSVDELAQDSPVFVMAVHVADHGIENKVFRKLYPASLSERV